MPTDTETRLRAIVVATLGCEPGEIQPDATFVKLGADSLDGVELAMDIEDAFGVDVSDGEIAETDTFGKMLALVEAKLAA